MDVNFDYANCDDVGNAPPKFPDYYEDESPMNKAVISNFANYSNALACQGAAIPPPMVNFNVPRLAYRFKAQPPPVVPETDALGRRIRHGGPNSRRQVDIISSILNYIERRIWDSSLRERGYLTQTHILYAAETYPMLCTRDKSVECVMTRLIRSAVNKIKCPIFDLCWTPEGRRLITGGSSGEFTLWNGTAFNFETILQAHDSAVRSMIWSHNQEWMVTADHDGYVKYWQGNMNNVAMFQAHRDAVRSLSFAPTDAKFATASDDSTIRIWDFKTLVEERVLRGHGSDVRAVDWHPRKGLIVTGSRDSQQPVKLWDPRSEDCIRTLHFHKSGVTTVSFNRNGNWLLTGSRDHLVKLIDIRTMNELFTYKGHYKDVTAVAWHPIHETIFVSGGSDGALIYWDTLSDRELTLVEGAHEQAIWALSWHPLGHILASGSNDNNTKFWTRNKPGDTVEDFYAAPQFAFDHASRTMDSGGTDIRKESGEDESRSPAKDDDTDDQTLDDVGTLTRNDSFDEESFYKVPGIASKIALPASSEMENREQFPVASEQCPFPVGQYRFAVPPPPPPPPPPAVAAALPFGHPPWIQSNELVRAAQPWRPAPIWGQPDVPYPYGGFPHGSHPPYPRMIHPHAGTHSMFVSSTPDQLHHDLSPSPSSPPHSSSSSSSYTKQEANDASMEQKPSSSGIDQENDPNYKVAPRPSRWGPPLPGVPNAPLLSSFDDQQMSDNHVPSGHIHLPSTPYVDLQTIASRQPDIEHVKHNHQLTPIAMLRAMGPQKSSCLSQFDPSDPSTSIRYAK